MRGETKTTWTKNRHEFLSLANAAGAAGVRARGVAFGTACSAFRMLGWVEQIPATIGVKVRITELGTRALQAWDAGQRGELDLRTGEELRQQVLEDVLDLAEQHQLDERLFAALLQRMPVIDAQRCIRRAVELAGLASPVMLKESTLDPQQLQELLDKAPPPMVLANDPAEGGMVLLDERGRVLEVVEGKAPPAQVKFHQGGVATLTEKGAKILERGGEYWPKDDPRVVAAEANAPPAGTETRTVTIVVDEQTPETHAGHAAVLKAMTGPRLFVPGGIAAAGDMPNGPAFQATPPEVWAEDDDDHGLAMCPSCDGRGIAGPLKLDCRTCKGEGSVRRTVRL